MSTGTLHRYGYNLTAFEFSTTPNANVLLFVGGLTNGYLDVPYLPELAKGLPEGWSLIQAYISSSCTGWATGSLERDAAEIHQLVKYLRSQREGKIVLMGHSTGCQDTMQYLTKLMKTDGFDEKHNVDAGILQAPVSDNEGLTSESEKKLVEELLVEAEKHIANGDKNAIMPPAATELMFDTPTTAYRFHSLLKPRQDDDYFSSFLTADEHATTFGLVSKPLLVLYGSKDATVPKYVDKQALVDSWKKATDSKYWSPLSKILQGATHDVGEGSDEGAVPDLVDTVVKFIKTI